MKRGDFLHSLGYGSWLVMFDRHHSNVVARGSLLEFAFRHASVVIFRNEGGDRLFALGGGEIDNPVDVTLDQEGKQEQLRAGGSTYRSKMR